MPKHRRHKVAVGLAVFNGAKYLAAAVESILAQSLGDFELLISDNASMDGTQEICQRFADEDRRVRYMRNAVNLGVTENFNIVFRAASSEYFRWAAHDDVMAPTYLQKCVAMLDSDQGAAAAHSLTREIDENGRVLGLEAEPLLLQSPRAAERYRAIVAGCEYAFWSVMRSDLIEQVRPHEPLLSSEYTFQAEIALRGRFAIVKEYLFDERSHAGRYSEQAHSPEGDAQWWGRRKSQSAWLHAPVGFYRQAQGVWHAPLEWDQKVLCWRHLGGCVAEYGSAIVRRNRQRVMGPMGRLGSLLKPHRRTRKKAKEGYHVSIS